MKTLLQIAFISLAVASVVAVSMITTAQASKVEQNWCIDVPGKTVCGYASHKACADDRPNVVAVYPDASKCHQLSK